MVFFRRAIHKLTLARGCATGAVALWQLHSLYRRVPNGRYRGAYASRCQALPVLPYD